MYLGFGFMLASAVVFAVASMLFSTALGISLAD